MRNIILLSVLISGCCENNNPKPFRTSVEPISLDMEQIKKENALAQNIQTVRGPAGDTYLLVVDQPSYIEDVTVDEQTIKSFIKHKGKKVDSFLLKKQNHVVKVLFRGSGMIFNITELKRRGFILLDPHLDSIEELP